MKHTTTCLAALLAVLILASSAAADVLGRRNLGIGMGRTRMGEETIDRTSLDYSARIRLPVNGNVDLLAFHQQAMLEGRDPAAQGDATVKMKTSEYGVGLAGHLLPQRRYDPFVRFGLSNLLADTTVGGKPTFADEQLMVEFGAGVEINLRKDVSLLLDASYHDNFKAPAIDYVIAGVSLNGWLNDLILIGIGVSGNVDTSDLSVVVTAAYGF
jgi:opacity protein-like surface antigen